MNSQAITDIPDLVKQLYVIVEELTKRFPGRKFTPDGHLIGSIGEVLAAHHYDLELLTASAETHDAQTKSGTLVQIKATQGKSVGLRAEPEHLIVLFLNSNGESKEIFNGPGTIAWKESGPMQKNGQRPITVSKLKKLMAEVEPIQRLPAKSLSIS